MKTRLNRQLPILSILFTILGTANAAVIVDTTTSSFYSFDSATSTQNQSNASSQADGLTMNITFTPNADDIGESNAMALLEIGEGLPMVPASGFIKARFIFESR